MSGSLAEPNAIYSLGRCEACARIIIFSVGCCDLNCKLHIIEEAADAKVGVLGV